MKTRKPDGLTIYVPKYDPVLTFTQCFKVITKSNTSN